MLKRTDMRFAAGVICALCVGSALAQSVQTHFSCSVTRNGDSERVIYADSGTIDIAQQSIKQFQWESALHRETHGFDCSIDDSDGLQAEVIDNGWRISLKNAVAARQERGFDNERGKNCTIRLLMRGDELQIKPTCAILCGSRSNFSELVVNLKTGACRYPE